MSVGVRSGLGVLLSAGCLALAVFAGVHGVLFGALLAAFTAALFAWAVYDNARVLRERAAQDDTAEVGDLPPR
ncbi:MAG TPA: hypothetical protein VFA70_03380 [Dehalococcoidia bacterium]|nr:hypothetical protein [Dehalococcoidia bacterium]